MDIEKSGCYKLYKCRSLLACDSGGTVYETSQRFEDSDGETSYNTIDENQSESGQSESIIYIIDNNKDDKLKTNNSPASQQTLADPNTHLDDDEFNVNNDSQCDILQYMKEENVDQEDNCKYYIVQCDDIDSTQNSATETLDSDSFDKENFEYYCDPINPNSSVEDNSIDSSNNDMVSGNTIIYTNYSSLNSEAGSTLNHRKRKQTYTVKNDSFTELLDDDDDSSDFHRRKLDNPFENLKMSSILKKDQCSNNQLRLMDHRRISLASSNDENSDPSSTSSNEELVLNSSQRSGSSRYSSSFSPNHKFLRVIDTHVRLNSDLTSADYFEYVQPREKIVESDMDKLLSPTIEMEISMTKHCKVNQFVPPIQGQVDYNGNEINMKEKLNQDSKSKTSENDNSIVDEAREVVEQQLISMAARAKKLGLEHNFNTSNECVVEEILFGLGYNDVQLEIDWVKIKNNFQSKVPLVSLENNNGYFTHHQQSNNSFKNVSCSLKDTLNDFNRFGGFPEENNHEGDKLSQTKAVHNVVQSSKDANDFASSDNSQKVDECSQSEPCSSFNSHSSFAGASSIISDANADYASEYVSNSSTTQKQPIAPLKMRIRKVSDNNQYVIDDSNTFNSEDNPKKTLKFQKNPDNKYECPSCLDKFRTKKLLNSHILENHNGPYDMECEICLMKFKKSSAHKKHQPWCERSTALKCEICQKDYCYRAALLRHKKTHED